MRAVIIATGEPLERDALGSRHLRPMLPLIDRPFVQHVVEFFVRQGVTRFDFLLSHQPETIESHLETGSRWGCRITYHLVTNPVYPYGVLHRLGLDAHAGERVLFGHADRLPIVELADATKDEAGSVLFVSAARGHALEEWTGWGLVTGRDLLAIPKDMREAQLSAHLRGTGTPAPILSDVAQVLAVRTSTEMLSAQWAVLEKRVSGLMLGGEEKTPGIWVSPSARVSATAELKAPVFIGPRCTVGPAAHLGPYGVVGAGCFIDRQCKITNSAVFAGSYVGEGVHLDGAVIDRNLAVNGRDSSALLFADPLTLGHSPGTVAGVGTPRIVPRLFALLLLVAASPLILLTILALILLRRGRVMRRKEVVRLPVAHLESHWPTYRLCSFGTFSEDQQRLGMGYLLLHVLPGLIHIVRGQLQFAGVKPRSPEEVRKLPDEWREVYLQAKAGLFTPTALLGPDAQLEERFAADAAYAVNQSWRCDLWLIVAFLGRAFWGVLARLLFLRGSHTNAHPLQQKHEPTHLRPDQGTFRTYTTPAPQGVPHRPLTAALDEELDGPPELPD